MRQILMVLVFLFGFVLKASLVLAAEDEIKAAANAETKEVAVTEATKTEAKAEAKAEVAKVEKKEATVEKADDEISDDDENVVIEKTEKITKTVKKSKLSPAQNPSKIENNINVHGASLSYAGQPSTRSEQSELAAAATVLGTKASLEESNQLPTSLSPVVGFSAYNGAWQSHISNSYSLGLILELPVSESFSVEAEGGHGKYNVSYNSQGHNFNQYNLGGNAKFYLSQKKLRPYVGAGFSGIYYENLYRTIGDPASRYNRWIGAGSLIGGADLQVANSMSVGLRAEWLVPVVNRPQTASNSGITAQGYEDASMVNTSFYRILGAVKIAF